MMGPIDELVGIRILLHWLKKMIDCMGVALRMIRLPFWDGY
jgi:hypothetical protein